MPLLERCCDHVVFVFGSVYVVSYIDRLAYVEPALHPRDESYLIMMNEFFDLLLQSACQYFIEGIFLLKISPKLEQVETQQKPFFFFFLRWSLTLLPGWSTVMQSWLTATSVSPVQAILLPQPPE